MTTYREQVENSLPIWLRRTLGDGFMGICWGLMADGVSHVESLAVRFGHLKDRGLPDDTLPMYAADRALPRYPAETHDEHKSRLVTAWDAYEFGGTEGGMVEQLELAGYPGCEIFTARDDWAVGDPDWSRYWVVVPAGTHSVTGPGANWGAGRTWGDGLLWGIATGEDDVRTVQQIVRKWNPVRWRCAGVIFVVSGAVWGAGSTWGGGATWGGSVVNVGV